MHAETRKMSMFVIKVNNELKNDGQQLRTPGRMTLNEKR